MINKIKAPMWDQMQFFCKRIADHQIRMVLHFNEILNKHLLKDAIIHTLENNPIAYANYEESTKEAFWNYSRLNIDKVYSFYESPSPEKLEQDAVLKQIDTLSEPQLTITLIRSKTDALILNCNHAITDGAGVKEFVYEIAENYTRLSLFLTNNNQLTTNKPSRSLTLLSKQLGMKDKSSILRTMLSNKRSAPTFDKKVDSDYLENPDFRTHAFNPSEFKALKEFGKLHGATINDMLLGVYFLTLKKLLSNSNKTNRLTFTSDLRAYLEDVEYDKLSNFSAIHNIDIDNTTDSFEDILRDVSTQTKLRKQMRYNFADFPMMAMLFKTLPYQKCKGLFFREFDKIKVGSSKAAPSITNLGIIDDKRIRFGSILPYEAFVLGGVNHPSLLQLVVSTYQNQLTISFGSYFNPKNEAFISSLINEINKFVKEYIMSDVKPCNTSN